MLNGHQIAQARKEKGLTQIQLAYLMHVSTEAVSKWEKGAYAPGPEKEDKLRRILGIAYAGADLRDVRFFHERNMSAFLKGKFIQGIFPNQVKHCLLQRKCMRVSTASRLS